MTVARGSDLSKDKFVCVFLRRASLVPLPGLPRHLTISLAFILLFIYLALCAHAMTAAR